MVLILLVYAGINFLSLWNSSLDFVSVFELDCLLLFRLSGSLQGFPERQRCSKYMRFSSCFKSWIQKEEWRSTCFRSLSFIWTSFDVLFAVVCFGFSFIAIWLRFLLRVFSWHWKEAGGQVFNTYSVKFFALVSRNFLVFCLASWSWGVSFPRGPGPVSVLEIKVEVLILCVLMRQGRRGNPYFLSRGSAEQEIATNINVS